MIRRLGALAGAALAALAFASSASAATTPVMKPIPYYACGTVTASWTPSYPTYGGTVVGYRVDLGDLTTGTSTALYTSGLSKVLPTVSGHKYVARVRAIEYHRGIATYSWPSGRVFKKLCLLTVAEISREYVAYNPWPECIMCRVDIGELQIDDPVIEKAVISASVPDAPERFSGIELDAEGAINFG